jgi:hypothetical protein
VGEQVNILETTNDCRSAYLAVAEESGSNPFRSEQVFQSINRFMHRVSTLQILQSMRGHCCADYFTSCSLAKTAP